MEAIAKHDCSVTLTTSLDMLSLNRMMVRKGDKISFPVYLDKEITGQVAEAIGNRTVVFIDNGILIPTYSKDFDYVEDK